MCRAHRYGLILAGILFVVNCVLLWHSATSPVAAAQHAKDLLPVAFVVLLPPRVDHENRVFNGRQVSNVSPQPATKTSPDARRRVPSSRP